METPRSVIISRLLAAEKVEARLPRHAAALVAARNQRARLEQVSQAKDSPVAQAQSVQAVAAEARAS
jgi:hypothetical protein